MLGVTDPSFPGPKDNLDSLIKPVISVAKLVLCEFDEFYFEFQQLTAAAKIAFENREYQASLQISEEKLALYGTSMSSLSECVPRLFPVAIQKRRLSGSDSVPTFECRWKKELPVQRL